VKFDKSTKLGQPLNVHINLQKHPDYDVTTLGPGRNIARAK
jgi:hypothetical protein